MLQYQRLKSVASCLTILLSVLLKLYIFACFLQYFLVVFVLLCVIFVLLWVIFMLYICYCSVEACLMYYSGSTSFNNILIIDLHYLSKDHQQELREKIMSPYSHNERKSCHHTFKQEKIMAPYRRNERKSCHHTVKLIKMRENSVTIQVI